MPLAFESLSHGSIAFGFFNIETDILILDHYFLFADEFCRYVEDLAENANESNYQTIWKVEYIGNADAIGDLMGAIHSIRYTGFIGELYRIFPFPPRPQDFKQNSQGFKTQSQVSEIIANYAQVLEIHIEVNNDIEEIQIGDYRFSRNQFQKLIAYVWHGGFPRWKDDIRPAYVTTMGDRILSKKVGIFMGIDFERRQE